MIKDSTTLRRFAKEQMGDEYYPSNIIFKGKRYTVYFEWCDDGEVDEQDRPLNGIVQFVDPTSEFSWFVTYYVYRNGDNLRLGADIQIHPELEVA
jgi:hypothetical protein